MKKKHIFGFIRDNIRYNNEAPFAIVNNYELSQKLAYELGFTSQVANIIQNAILFISHSGDAEKDASKITAKVKESIWM